ncbi:hypothetical protein K435DRAFT_866748 [Dendrothele bispora CBS 962.96]|uniref:DDE Tnp4 domain-containing protein n=1 Tax=Dendrothele bispora (strain CBS 962.96) TaxID=1314807 RepID=A0A4S8LGK7_DENBC|nr:hypothetical protein K435DRAFT_866748 [Dendrothele bispora CBS 962.96]
MPRFTIAEAQSDYMSLGCTYLLAAHLVQPQNDDDSDSDDSQHDVDSKEEDWEEEDVEMGEDELEVIFQVIGTSLMAYGDGLDRDGECGPYFQYPKSKDYFDCCLNAADRNFRVGKPMFDHLVFMLEPNPIIHSTGQKPQRPVKYQLAAFLFRYGTLGSDVAGTAHKLGIGYGSVINYCRQVTRAIREMKSKFVGFTSETEQQTTMFHIEEATGFPGCIGSGDGSLIRFDEKPRTHGT